MEAVEEEGEAGPFVPEACRGPARPVTLRLVLEHSLTKGDLAKVDQLEVEELIEQARTIKNVHLEWLGIAEISNLDPFENTEALYLQYNRIERIEGLESLSKLNFLALQNNHITVIENLLHLQELEFLDLSGNRIARLDEQQIPESVNMLNLRGNPCTHESDYGPRIHARLPDLLTFDGLSIQEQLEVDGVLEVTSVPSSPLRPSSSDLAVSQKLAKLAALKRSSPDRLPTASEDHEGEDGEDVEEERRAAYFARDEMRTGASARARELIQAYAVESLADAHDFTRKVEEATERSMARRRQLAARPRSSGGFSSSRSLQISSLTEEQLADVRRLNAAQGGNDGSASAWGDGEH